LGLTTKAAAKVDIAAAPTKTEFKVPDIPIFKAPAKPMSKPATTNFDIFEDSEGEIEDLSKSIYQTKPPQELGCEDEGEWECERMASFVADAFNQYEHTIVEEDPDLSLKVQEAIKKSRGNPFDDRVRYAMLEHCNFSVYLEEHVPNCSLLKKIPQLKPGVPIECAGDEFTVLKFIAKGAFGSIFTAKNRKTGKVWAMKQEKPANLWEYYICVELMDRIKDKRMIPAFMKIECAIIANNSSILVTEFSPYGSIIDACNKHKNATTRNVDEYVVMVITTQLLSIIDHLHGCKIIHGDIKPDNFLLMSK
jgi:checkpoint serine/threonine-protein kinase